MSADLSFLDFTASEVVGCFLKTCPLVDGSGRQRSLLTPNAVGKMCHLCPRSVCWSLIASYGVTHTSCNQLLLPERVWGLRYSSLWSRGRVLLLGARRMRCGHVPKTEPGYGYQRREMDAGAKTTDVYFKTLLFRHNLLLKHNRLKQIRREFRWLVWGWRAWVLLCVSPASWAHRGSKSPSPAHCLKILFFF